MLKGFMAKGAATILAGVIGLSSLRADDKSKLDWSAIEEAERDMAAACAKNPPCGSIVWTDAICLHLQPGSCAEMGLLDGPSIRSLTNLEKRLLLNTLKSKKDAEILSDTRTVFASGTNGRIQIGDEELKVELSPNCAADGTKVTLHLVSTASGRKQTKDLELLPIGTVLIVEKGKGGRSEIIWIMHMHAIHGMNP